MSEQNFDKSTIDFFKGVSDFFDNLTSTDGSLICYKHVSTEHTGKNIYSVAIDSKLYELTGENKYYERALSRVRRTTDLVVQDPEYGYWTFQPGRFGKRNMSNVVVDAGACLDVLSNFYLSYGHKLTEQERDKIKDAIFRNADTFLSERGLKKPVTNQRVWGGTGLACAYRIFKKEDWRENLIGAIEKSFEEMWADGTFPYHPYWKEYKMFEGIYDTNPYYQSRCIDFIYYILDNIDADVVVYKDQLVRATDALVAMYQPNGIKNINLECKRWYWNSSYEVGSNTFDIYALVKTYQLTGNNIYAYYAKKSFQQISKHVLDDGGVTSHLDSHQDNFKCRIFWNAHLVWLLRAVEELPNIQYDEYTAGEEFNFYEDSGVCKFKNKNYSCILRGKKHPMSLMWGPSTGGGSLLYFGTSQGDWNNILFSEGWERNVPGGFQFFVRENYLKNFLKFVIKDRVDIKQKLYHISVEILGLRFRTSLVLLVKLARMVFSWNRDIFTSQWATNVTAQKQDRQIIFDTMPTKRNGEVLNGVKMRREYGFEEDRLCIREDITIESFTMKRIKYSKIINTNGFKIDTNLKYKESDQGVTFYPGGTGSYIKISYSL